MGSIFVGVYVGVFMWGTYMGDVVYGDYVDNVGNRMVTGFVDYGGVVGDVIVRLGDA